MRHESASESSPPGVRCVLCGGSSLRALDRVSADSIAAQWLQKYGISVRRYFPAASVTDFLCESCGLEFFHPQSPGDERMYEQLQRFDWYYEPDKWEFRQALALVGAPGPALEVGSGPGNFLLALHRAGFGDVCGLDPNRRAREAAEQNGIRTFASLDELEGRRFDYIFAFQVLEHVPDPRSFLEALASRLSDRGRLFVAVPNQDSFISVKPDDEMNCPPHHCLRFRLATLRGLGRAVPLECERIVVEPLSAQHIGWYLTARMRQLRLPPKVSTIAWRTVAPLARLALRLGPLRRRIQGHSVLAVLRPRTPRAGEVEPARA